MWFKWYIVILRAFCRLSTSQCPKTWSVGDETEARAETSLFLVHPPLLLLPLVASREQFVFAGSGTAVEAASGSKLSSFPSPSDS